MAELKEIETKDEGGMSSVKARLPCLPDAHIFALHRASKGPRRIDLRLGGIQTMLRPEISFCRPYFAWLAINEYPITQPSLGLIVMQQRRSVLAGGSGSTTA